MRYLMMGVFLAIAAPLAFARAIPDPAQKHAPGNEEPQKPIAQAGYGAAVNYQLQCAGCHLDDGSGAAANDTPNMKGFVGNFLKVEGGREFLVRVPGASQSAMNNAQLAELMNWIMHKDGIAGKSVPDDFKPYTEEEVASVRHQVMLDLPGVRRGLIERMRAQHLAIEDGVSR